MKKFACSNVVADCSGVVTGETEDEVLAAVAAHAASAHGLAELSSDVVAVVRGAIQDD